MSQQFIVVSRKNLQKPEEAPKFYALARSMRSVTVDGTIGITSCI